LNCGRTGLLDHPEVALEQVTRKKFMSIQKDPEGYEEKILHRFARFEGKHVLEIGCGDGRLTWKYATSARSVTGVDVELDDLRLARADRPYGLESKVTFTQSSARHIPFPREIFDIAVLAWSL
jgi:ubiquinone/menaquinone biosynthesis C-methylase UbiE